MRLSRSGPARLAPLLLLAAWPVGAAETLTPFDVARIRSVGSVVLSPDGSRVAYTLSVPRRVLDEEDGAAWAELHVVGRDGASRAFVTGAVNVADIAWTKDGKEISFIARRGKDENRCLYAIPADGGEARRLICHDADIASYSFAPDGRRVAFLAADGPSPKQKDLEKKGFNQQVYEESARPVRIWVATTEAGGAKPKALPVQGSASELRWSPAGALLAVALAPTSLVDDNYMSRRVTILDADSGKVVARIDNPGKLGQIAWSPDGKTVAYVSGADKNDPSAGRLMAVSSAGGSPRDLLPGYEGNVARIAWRDADTILFHGDEGVETILGEVSAGHPGRPGKHAIGVSLGSFDVSRDGKVVALAAQTPSHPSEVFLWALSERAPRRLTTSNPWLSGMRLAPQEVVTFKARDGLALEGLLIRPLDEKKGERYPLILAVHGGPEGHYRNGWLTSYSDAGAGRRGARLRGLLPELPRPHRTRRGVLEDGPGGPGRQGVRRPGGRRGSPRGVRPGRQGEGRHHRRLLRRLRDGLVLDALLRPLRGGRDVRRHQRPRRKAGTTDIPKEEMLVHASRWPWEDWKLMLERSPIFYADKSRTPLLILDGKDDPRVHPSQSLELYRYLKVQSKAPVRLVLYPGEGHGNRSRRTGSTTTCG